MEWGIKQYFLLAAFAVFAIIDLLTRWSRRKAAKDQRAGGGDEEPVLVEEGDFEQLEQRQVEPQVAHAPRPSPRASISPAAPAPRPTRAPTSVSPRRRRGARSWLRHPIDGRRGIVLMAILGTCRGLETPHLGATDSGGQRGA